MSEAAVRCKHSLLVVQVFKQLSGAKGDNHFNKDDQHEQSIKAVSWHVEILRNTLTVRTLQSPRSEDVDGRELAAPDIPDATISPWLSNEQRTSCKLSTTACWACIACFFYMALSPVPSPLHMHLAYAQ